LYKINGDLVLYRFAIELMLIRRSAKIKRSGFLHRRNNEKTDNIVSNQWRIGIRSEMIYPECQLKIWNTAVFANFTKSLSKLGECLFFLTAKNTDSTKNSI